MLTINVNWECFFGIIGTLIALAYYANGRFTRIETNFEWLADTVRDLTIKAENISARAFDVHSPISLTETGEQLLRDSGLKSYIDRRRDELTGQLRTMAPLDLYTVRDSAFRLFHHISLDMAFTRQLNRFAFRNGTSVDLLKRIGAIYLRDLAIAPH
ncbi:hypothetical protein NLM33_32605 [Bradyrhizobium sp. CCGUVB1N3]|uniref:hypothetical protein n=1 Tax=Bradyrhizobium sp. CCGUVB1N3 TaxID=2949629 RepID=UPI0020B2A403|nr:hypothetical protein [Bradyrhizobium sp. CCGUVB1N3]MCP3475065.1 hypothetical protein [Bradyrhizobium sp. CCGUVB1N3]